MTSIPGWANESGQANEMERAVDLGQVSDGVRAELQGLEVEKVCGGLLGRDERLGQIPGQTTTLQLKTGLASKGLAAGSLSGRKPGPSDSGPGPLRKEPIAKPLAKDSRLPPCQRPYNELGKHGALHLGVPPNNLSYQVGGNLDELIQKCGAEGATPSLLPPVAGIGAVPVLKSPRDRRRGDVVECELGLVGMNGNGGFDGISNSPNSSRNFGKGGEADAGRLGDGLEKEMLGLNGVGKVGGAVNYPHVTPRRSFAEAIRGHRNDDRGRALKRVEVDLDDEGGILMPMAIAEQGNKMWQNTLVGVVLGRKIPFAVIDKNVRRMWSNKGVVEIVNAGSGLILVRFLDDKWFDSILKKSDWSIVGCPFLVKRWAPGVSYEALEPTHLPLWVRVKHVPLEYCHFEGIEYIVSSFGKPLRIDSGNYAREGVRVQVEVEAMSPIKRSLRLIGMDGDKAEVKLEYEFLPPQCTRCRVFGHDCEKKKADGGVMNSWKQKNGDSVVEQPALPTHCKVGKVDSISKKMKAKIVYCDEVTGAVGGSDTVAEEEDVEVVESSFPEELVKLNNLDSIPIAANKFQVLQVEEIAAVPTPLAGEVPSMAAPSLLTNGDRLPEILGCCVTAQEAGLDLGSEDSHRTLSSPSLAASESDHGEWVDPLEFKEDFIREFCAGEDSAGRLEDSSTSAIGAASSAPSEGSSEIEVQIGRMGSPPRTRNRAKDLAVRECGSTRRGRKSRKASK